MTDVASIDANAPDPPGKFHRIIDAALNRATEGLRIAEDIARFALQDAFLARSCKEIRHELVGLIGSISPQAARIRARDTDGDVGTGIAAPAEYVRSSLVGLAASNFRRAQQGIRTLEELAKLAHAEVAAKLERLRYQLYTLEIPFALTMEARNRLARCRLCVLIDGGATLTGFCRRVEELLDAGTPMIQLRDKRLNDQALLERAGALMERVRQSNALGVINDRVDIAVAASAHGVHVGDSDLPVALARRQLPSDALAGASTHSLPQARQAVMAGADYLGVGPVFPSQTKTFPAVRGLDLVRQVSAEIGLPWFAIGGITPENLESVLDAGAARVAVSHSVLAAESPGQVVRTFLRTLAARPEESQD